MITINWTEQKVSEVKALLEQYVQEWDIPEEEGQQLTGEVVRKHPNHYDAVLYISDIIDILKPEKS